MPWFLLLCFLFLTACPGGSDPSEVEATPSPLVLTAAEKDLVFTLSPMHPPSPDASHPLVQNPAAQKLGQYLFFDTRMSPSGRFACVSCHQPALGFADGQPLGQGLGKLTRHTPSLWNVAYQRWFFWDGRTDSLWSQAIQPLESELEMGSDRAHVYHLFQQEASLKKAYENLFGPLPQLRLPPHAKPMKDTTSPKHKAWEALDKNTQDQLNRFISNVLKTLAAYEFQLVSQPAPFDRFVADLRTQKTSEALSVPAQRGLRLFMGKGQCILCHTGPQFTDKEFHNTGLPPLSKDPHDMGRFQGVKDLKSNPFNLASEFADLSEEDPLLDKLLYLDSVDTQQGEFKTPGLRQVAQTAPYMHDGRFQTLEQVIAFYARPPEVKPAVGRREDTIQPLKMDVQDLKDLVAFLKSLSGEPLPQSLTQAPKSPLLD